MAEIQLTDVCKRYPDGFKAVKHMNLDIGDGEFMILVGPSGCGKSTALRMIAGLEEITDGELAIAGERVNDVAPRERDIAMVFQNYALYPHMTVRENMGFALKLAKVDAGEIDRKVDEAAQILDLTQHLKRRPASLSGGQRQRVAMGRAIVRDPKAFLMDEPLSNLDAKLRVQMRTEVARIQKRLGTTTVYVTHDQTEAMTLGDRVAVMRGGVIQQVDSPKTLYDDPVNLFVAGFIGSPAMNLLPARLEGDRVRLPFGDARLPDTLRRRLTGDGAGRDVIAGIRPEHSSPAGTRRSSRPPHRHSHDIEAETTGQQSDRSVTPKALSPHGVSVSSSQSHWISSPGSWTSWTVAPCPSVRHPSQRGRSPSWAQLAHERHIRTLEAERGDLAKQHAAIDVRVVANRATR